jgi:hypothetical protein
VDDDGVRNWTGHANARPMTGSAKQSSAVLEDLLFHPGEATQGQC